MDWRPDAALLALALAGCAATARDAAMPPGAAVLAGDKAADLTRQCSRRSPAPSDATWQPAAADIAALEAALPGALERDDRSGWTKAPGDWRRQYVGLARNGVRTIYGNFIPATVAEHGDWRTMPSMVCDGGPRFFGVEYDVAARRFVGIDYNGSY